MGGNVTDLSGPYLVMSEIFLTIYDSITLADVAGLVVTHHYDSEHSIDSD
jgi:hypothetical protein